MASRSLSGQSFSLEKWLKMRYNIKIAALNLKMPIFTPRTVAVIGASAQEGKVGHDILKNLLTQGFGGEVFPVNPKGGEILGKKAFASITDIPTDVDLAVIVIPAALVAQALEECGKKKVKTVIVISAGFGETHTDEGRAMETQFIDIAKKHDMRLIGPNCLGIVRPSIKMNASFAKDLPPVGNIAVVSQSGAMGVALMDSAIATGMGLSCFVSIGNKALTDEADMLEMLADDDETNVIGLYLESINNGRRFMDVASRVAAKKPIVLLKAGVSAKGASAAASHTGALAGTDAAITALCAQTGIIRADDTEQFLDTLNVLSVEPPLLSRRIAIVTNAGGPGILATDAAQAHGLELPHLSAKTDAALKTALPSAASTANPIDVIGDAGADRYEAALNACSDDPNIDGVCVILTPQVMTPCDDVARTIVNVMKTAPLMPVVTAFMGGESVANAKKILRDAGIPTFETPERAVRALASLQTPQPRRAAAMSFSNSSAAPPLGRDDFTKDKIGLLDEATTQKLFAAYDLPMPKQALATTADEAVRIAADIGYPVIAKISSPDILHKTDIGGVRANLKTEADVRSAFNEIMSNVQKNAQPANPQHINGILIQQFLPIGNEFIVGALRDPQFGHLVMVGLGGIYTELFKDTSFRIAPIREETAYHMLQSLKSWQLLLGMRGKKQSDIDALASLICHVSQMVSEHPRIKELDLNPVLVSDQGLIIADAKVVIG